MICGNGEIHRNPQNTIISIEIPHKKLQTEDISDVALYVKASLVDINKILEPLIGSKIGSVQNKTVTILSFTKPNSDYLIRELQRYINNSTSHDTMRIDSEIFKLSHDERISFLRGFADVTGYIRRSNYFYEKYDHRVYLEIPNNWMLVIDICNLLKSLDIPVQTIDWAHPNMRDGNLTKYNQGNSNFWKKEHQIKIYANEFLPVSFQVIHKRESLSIFAKEMENGYKKNGKDISSTHRHYWERKMKDKEKPKHPSENDSFIPECIRGKHYDSWMEIARDLGYDK